MLKKNLTDQLEEDGSQTFSKTRKQRTSEINDDYHKQTHKYLWAKNKQELSEYLRSETPLKPCRKQEGI